MLTSVEKYGENMFKFIMAEMKASIRQWIVLGVFIAVSVCMLCLSVGFIAVGSPYAGSLDFGLRDISEEYISLGDAAGVHRFRRVGHHSECGFNMHRNGCV